jgi:hypothetical protein
MKRISFSQPNLRTVLRNFRGSHAAASRVSEGVAQILADIRAPGDEGTRGARHPVRNLLSGGGELVFSGS